MFTEWTARRTPPHLPTLPRDLYYQAVHELSRALPPPATDTAEDQARQRNTLVARVADLRPANADQVVLACQYIAAAAQALECLRLANQFPDDAVHVLKGTAQAASMMRQSRGARAQLLRLQAERHDRSRPKPVTAPAAAQPDDSTADLTPAEQYALAHPSKAALIRSLGRLPRKFDDPSVTPELVRGIVTSASPILQSLVKQPPHRLAA
jgi:hypothetical protein